MTVDNAHRFSLTVQIFDTDCYGVMWHGAYAKWLEMGRVALCNQLGLPIQKPTEAEWLYPVIDQHLQYKGSVTVGDSLDLATTVRVDGFRLVFEQHVTNIETGSTVVQAETTCVVVDPAWKLQRRLPPSLLACLSSQPSY